MYQIYTIRIRYLSQWQILNSSSSKHLTVKGLRTKLFFSMCKLSLWFKYMLLSFGPLSVQVIYNCLLYIYILQLIVNCFFQVPTISMIYLTASSRSLLSLWFIKLLLYRSLLGYLYGLYNCFFQVPTISMIYLTASSKSLLSL